MYIMIDNSNYMVGACYVCMQAQRDLRVVECIIKPSNGLNSISNDQKSNHERNGEII